MRHYKVAGLIAACLLMLLIVAPSMAPQDIEGAGDTVPMGPPDYWCAAFPAAYAQATARVEQSTAQFQAEVVRIDAARKAGEDVQILNQQVHLLDHDQARLNQALLKMDRDRNTFNDLCAIHSFEPNPMVVDSIVNGWWND